MNEIIQIGNCRPTKTRKNPNQGRIYDTKGISPSLNTCGGGNLEPHIIDEHDVKLKIRKLTPKECFRLMGFSDDDIDILIENGISNTQLYKMAGNSIVVDVTEEIFCQIFDSDGEIWL